jgi:cytochrome oxidase assembly protein ShyY1
VYRFLLTPRWLGILALTLVATAVMILLGNWQLSRYHERSGINHRIDAAAEFPPAPLGEVLPAASSAAGTAGKAPPAATAWTRVTVTGRYDDASAFLIRSRSVQSQVGFEVVTPLVLADGTAVLVDRGWIPPAAGAATARPVVPPAPTGQVTVVGRVHLSESRPDAIQQRDGRLETRRISVPRLATMLPYPTYGAYLLLDEQTPAADPAFSAIPAQHENDWQNAGYTVQWWLFGVMALFGFGWAARREAHGLTGSAAERAPQDRAAEPTPTSPA